jgi:hypothetical protein
MSEISSDPAGEFQNVRVMSSHLRKLDHNAALVTVKNVMIAESQKKRDCRVVRSAPRGPSAV